MTTGAAGKGGDVAREARRRSGQCHLESRRCGVGRGGRGSSRRCSAMSHAVSDGQAGKTGEESRPAAAEGGQG